MYSVILLVFLMQEVSRIGGFNVPSINIDKENNKSTTVFQKLAQSNTRLQNTCQIGVTNYRRTKASY